MRAFLFRVLLFSLFLGVLLVGMQLFYARVVRRDAYRTDREFWSKESPVRVLAVGDSHVRNGFDTREVPGSYNLSSSGENLVQTYFRLKAVLEDPAVGETVETVVLSFDMHSFSSYKSERFPDMYFWDRYVDWWEVSRSLGSPWEFYSRSLVERAVPYAGNWRLIRSWAQGSETLEPVYRDGFLLDERDLLGPSSAERSSAGVERAAHHFRGHRSEDPFLVEYFDRILSLCEESGVEVLLVRFPVSDEYFEATVDSLGVDPDLVGPSAVAADHGIEPIDALWREFGHQPELFADADHLNHRGAREFTRRLESLFPSR